MGRRDSLGAQQKPGEGFGVREGGRVRVEPRDCALSVRYVRRYLAGEGEYAAGEIVGHIDAIWAARPQAARHVDPAEFWTPMSPYHGAHNLKYQRVKLKVPPQSFNHARNDGVDGWFGDYRTTLRAHSGFGSLVGGLNQYCRRLKRLPQRGRLRSPARLSQLRRPDRERQPLLTIQRCSTAAHRPFVTGA
jgi:hypothetical protein